MIQTLKQSLKGFLIVLALFAVSAMSVSAEVLSPDNVVAAVSVDQALSEPVAADQAKPLKTLTFTYTDIAEEPLCNRSNASRYALEEVPWQSGQGTVMVIDVGAYTNESWTIYRASLVGFTPYSLPET